MAEATAGSRGMERTPVPARAEAGAPIRFERRDGARSRARGQGVAAFIDPDGRYWLTRVSLLDRSESGLGVRAPVPISPGATFTLSIEGAPAATQGVVAHSVARGGVYRLGLRCSRRLAA